MTQTQHTPGPWSYNRAEGGYQGHFISTGDCIICDLPDAEDFLAVKRAAPQTEANARLIAAAPDMLEALRLCERALEERDAEQETYAAKKARAAIAKATDA